MLGPTLDEVVGEQRVAKKGILVDPPTHWPEPDWPDVIHSQTIWEPQSTNLFTSRLVLQVGGPNRALWSGRSAAVRRHRQRLDYRAPVSTISTVTCRSMTPTPTGFRILRNMISAPIRTLAEDHPPPVEKLRLLERRPADLRGEICGASRWAVGAVEPPPIRDLEAENVHSPGRRDDGRRPDRSDECRCGNIVGAASAFAHRFGTELRKGEGEDVRGRVRGAAVGVGWLRSVHRA